MPDYKLAAQQAAQRHGLDPRIFARQINAESGFNPNAGSGAGAIGIAQFMPATAAGLGINPRNPLQALDGAAKLMAGYVKKYGNYKDALVAYNAGPGRVGKPLFGETQAYVAKILQGADPKAGAGRSSSSSTTTTTTPGTPATPGTPGVDNSAQRAALIQQFLGRAHQDPLQFALGIKGLQDTPAVAATPGTPATVTTSPGQSASAASVSAPPGGHGLVTIDGHHVVAWMVPAINYAKAHGWGGAIASGVRTTAEQAQLYARYQAGGNIAAKPGQSNHEIQNGGAIDVTDPSAFAKALRGYKGKALVQGLAIGDPVHFSATGH